MQLYTMHKPDYEGYTLKDHVSSDMENIKMQIKEITKHPTVTSAANCFEAISCLNS